MGYFNLRVLLANLSHGLCPIMNSTEMGRETDERTSGKINLLLKELICLGGKRYAWLDTLD